MNNVANSSSGYFNTPKLIETGASNYLNKALLHSHKFKKEYNQYVYNITLLIITGVIVVCIILFLYKRALVVKNNEYKHSQVQYVLNSLNQINQETVHPQKTSSLLTGLPVWDSTI
jgi:hypothetical protein